jgi:zinc D-Ala-D-Ala carboxypeptidase
MDPALKTIHRDLGILDEHLSRCRLPLSEQPPLKELEVVDIDFDGRPFILTARAAVAWREMCQAARRDEVILDPFSGFRSYIYQKQLVARKLEKGQSLEEIFTVLAIPGFSEHHTGRAVDICTDNTFELTEEFEKTDAFLWLNKNAVSFRFRLSYPRDNGQGIIYEPWHWCFESSLK